MVMFSMVAMVAPQPSILPSIGHPEKVVECLPPNRKTLPSAHSPSLRLYRASRE